MKEDKKVKKSFAKCEELKELSDENKMTVKTLNEGGKKNYYSKFKKFNYLNF
jgi:hypothetical protein